MAYTSQALVKAYLGIPSSTSSENTAIDNAIAAADAEIDQITGRTFVVPSGATAKTFIPYDDYTLYVDDVAQLTGLVVKEDTSLNGTYDTTLTITTDYVVDGNNAPYRVVKRVDGDTWPRDRYGRPTVEVTAFYGYGMAVPDQIKQCSLVIAARLYQRRSSPLGFQAGSVDVGFVRISRTDPEVIALLRGLKIPAAA
jgi:hypothetical protein|tara:strand:+ start:1992 stop:2582 length:591 start_codon:yes stop_codon:yes gene_type:complete